MGYDNYDYEEAIKISQRRKKKSIILKKRRQQILRKRIMLLVSAAFVIVLAVIIVNMTSGLRKTANTKAAFAADIVEETKWEKEEETQ